MFRFDLEKEEQVPLKLAPHLTKSDVVGETFVPRDGKHYYVGVGPFSRIEYRILKFAIQDSGNLTLQQTFGPWHGSEDQSASALFVTPNGALQYVRGRQYLEHLNGAAEPHTKFTLKAPTFSWKAENPGFEHRPNHDELVVTYRDKKKEYCYIEFWNTKTGERLGGRSLPNEKSRFRFSPDGNLMIASGAGSSEVNILNPDNLIPETPKAP